MTDALQHDDIQLLISHTHGRLRAARFVFLRLGSAGRGAGRKWLSDLAEEVSVGSQKAEERAVQVAVAASGLVKLGLSPEVMDTFLREFREGMADPERARGLGDVHDSAPDKWHLGGRGDNQVDFLLMLYAKDAPALKALASIHDARLRAAGLTEVAAHDTLLDEENREPFGFVDGLSQPLVEGMPSDSKSDRGGGRQVRAGEFVLGYKNEYDKVPFSPHLPAAQDRSGLLPAYLDRPGFKDFGKNGTYLVVRKLEQDVDAFNSFLETRAVDPRTGVADRNQKEWLAAKLMGRWRDGRPVAQRRDEKAGDEKDSSLNNFDYKADPEGLGCPFGAHARRANPRNPLAAMHRIIRRGRPYEEVGRDGQRRRGFLFLAINANIGRQFEFIQQSWLNDPNFEGLEENRDPVVGANHQAGCKEPPQSFAMVVPATPFRIRLTGIPRFVHTRGGEYFFMPGRQALRFLGTSEFELQTEHEPAPDRPAAAPVAYASPGPILSPGRGEASGSASDDASARASLVYHGMSMAEN